MVLPIFHRHFPNFITNIFLKFSVIEDDCTLVWKKLKLTSEVMAAIHIPKSGKTSSLHDPICHQCPQNVQQAQKAVCHHWLSHDTERQTATENIHMDLLATTWPHLFFSKNYLFFPCFHSGHGSRAPVFSSILNFINTWCRKVQGDFTGKRCFFVHNSNISYAWLPLCACHCEKLPNSKLNKLILALLKKKLCQNCSTQRNPNHKTILTT